MNTISHRTLRQLQILADSLKANPEYMAHVFANYQRVNNWSDFQLIKMLDVTQEIFLRTAICKRPVENAPDFSQQVKQIAVFTNMDPTILANVVRQVDSLQAFLSKPDDLISNRDETQLAQFRSGLVAAARDRTETEPSSDDDASHTSGEEGIDEN